MLSPEALSSRTVVQLKEMLRARGLPVSGRKAVLIERLMGAKAAVATPGATEAAAAAAAASPRNDDTSSNPPPGDVFPSSPTPRARPRTRTRTSALT